MDSELLTVFNENYEPIGVKTRGDVHKYGYWHEAFHCWFISKINNGVIIYFQLRSEHKKDYPNLLDITAAGHLLSSETVADGVREVKEELGVDVKLDELASLGMMRYVVHNTKIIDKEFAHVYLHDYKNDINRFNVQREEVAGMFYAKFEDFFDLWMGNKKRISIQGFILDKFDKKIYLNRLVGREHFVPHDETFYVEVVENIKAYCIFRQTLD